MLNRGRLRLFLSIWPPVAVALGILVLPKLSLAIEPELLGLPSLVTLWLLDAASVAGCLVSLAARLEPSQ